MLQCKRAQNEKRSRETQNLENTKQLYTFRQKSMKFALYKELLNLASVKYFSFFKKKTTVVADNHDLEDLDSSHKHKHIFCASDID